MWLEESVSQILFDVADELFHRHDEEESLQSALVFYDNRDWEKAKKALEPIARSGNLKALFKFANTLDNLGEGDAAVHFWQIGVRGGDTDACNNLANYFKSIGNVDEAKRLYEIAAAVDQSDALFNLGLLYDDDDPEKASSYFAAAVKAGHGQVCGKLSHESKVEGRIDLMLEYAQLGIERGDFFSPMVLALYYFENQNWEESLRYVKVALSTDGVERRPQYASALSLLASVQVSMGDFESGLQTAELAVAHGATDAQPIVDLLSTTLRKCSNCFKPFDQHDKFCSQCGAPLDGR
jgi:tetratricopeptide (TPR) repeat protein